MTIGKDRFVTLDNIESQESSDAGWQPRTISLLRDSGTLSALLFLILLAFAPWWAGGRLFAPLDLLDGLYEPWHDAAAEVQVKNHFTSDGLTQYIGYRHFAERAYAEDGRVGWSDLTLGGRPAYANTMAGYDDWTMQLHRFLDFWTAWHLGLAAQFLVAALGIYVFLRSQRISPIVGLLGAVAYAANSQFILVIYTRYQLAAFAWVPWAAWAMYRYRSGHRWAWPLVPVFLALAFLGGTVQTSAFVALAGFALYPNMLMLAESMAQGMNRGQVGYKGGIAQPILSAIFMLLQPMPTLLGSPRSMDLSKVLALELHDIAYFGFIPMVLAYRAALLRRAPAAARWLIAFGLLLPLTPLAGPLYHRVQLVFIFGGVWAFAWYWEHAERGVDDPVLRHLLRIVLAFVVIWLLGSLLGVIFHDRLQGRIEAYVAGRIAGGQAGVFGGHREAWLIERGRNLLHEMRLWHPRQLVAVSAALLGFAALRLRARRGVPLSAALLLGVLVVELGAFAGGWVTVVDPAEHPPFAETADIAALRERVGEGRVYIVDDPAAPSLFPPNTLSMYGVATIQAYETVNPASIWGALDFATDPATLGRVAVTHAVSRPGEVLEEGWVPEYRGERLMLWRNEYALPRYIALREGGGGWPVRTGAGGEGDVVADVVNPALTLPALLVAGTQNHRLLEVPAGTELVRVAENWSEGWRYRVEGEEWRPVEQAADRSMLLPLGPGTAPVRVELEYRPRRRVIGWWLTAGALVVTALGGGMVIGGALRRPV
jgi:hypothetical protein